MTPTTREAAAKAMHSTSGPVLDRLGNALSWQELSEPHQNDYLRMADAAAPVIESALMASLAGEVETMERAAEAAYLAYAAMVAEVARLTWELARFEDEYRDEQRRRYDAESRLRVARRETLREVAARMEMDGFVLTRRYLDTQLAEGK